MKLPVQERTSYGTFDTAGWLHSLGYRRTSPESDDERALSAPLRAPLLNVTSMESMERSSPEGDHPANSFTEQAVIDIGTQCFTSRPQTKGQQGPLLNPREDLFCWFSAVFPRVFGLSLGQEWSEDCFVLFVGFFQWFLA